MDELPGGSAALLVFDNGFIVESVKSRESEFPPTEEFPSGEKFVRLKRLVACRVGQTGRSGRLLRAPEWLYLPQYTSSSAADALSDRNTRQSFSAPAEMDTAAYDSPGQMRQPLL